MRGSHPNRLALETSAFQKDVARIKDNYEALHALERKLSRFLDSPQAER